MATKPQFTKISSNQKAIAIDWLTKRRTASEVEEHQSHHLGCPEKPRPAFEKALQAFLPYLITILGAPAEWKGNTRITGVSINKEEDGRRGVVLTASRKCPHGPSPVAINAPHLREPMTDAEQAGTNFFLPGMADAIDTLCEEAQAYLDGDRSQGELFGEPPKEKKRKGKGGDLEKVGDVLGRIGTAAGARS